MQLSVSRQMRLRASAAVICSSRRPAALALAPRHASAAATVAAAAAAAAPASRAQPLGDLALGGGRLANKLVESITNPKEDKGLAKQRQKWREQQEADKARRQREEESDAEHQQQLQAAVAAAADAHHDDQQRQQQMVDPLGLPLEGEQQAAAAAAAEGAAPAEAVASAVSAQQAAAAVQQQSIVSEYTEELVEVEARTVQERLVETRQWLGSTAAGKGVLAASGLFLAATLAVAVARTWQKYSSPRAQRIRTVDKNKLLVEELIKYLPARRSELTPAVVKKLRGATGFTAVEVFRKFLWYLLRERSFDDSGLADMVALKAAAGLSDDEVAEALRERAQRIYDKYGTLMLNTEGMTAEGVERKATCRALFGKLLYLTEHNSLVAAGSEAFKVADLRTIFGATDEDVEKLRIVSLHPMDVDRLESLMAGPDAAAAGPDSSSSSSSSAPPSQQQ